MNRAVQEIPPGVKWIRSRSNPLIKEVRSLRHAKFRAASGRYVLEGVRLVADALDGGAPLRYVLVSPRLFHGDRGRRLAGALLGGSAPVTAVPDELMAALHDTRTHQGVVAVAARHPVGLEDLPTGPAPTLVVAHRVQDPGNMGAILRSADASGADAVVTTPDSADPFNPKTVRTTMGSLFRLPVAVGVQLPAVVDWCRQRRLPVLAAHGGGEPLHRFRLREGFALVAGREGDGLAETDLALADRAIAVPMREPAESLNVSAAVAVILYEAARQRGYRFRPPFGGLELKRREGDTG